ncbi:MAG: hypothetical protein QOH33_2438, partial [Paraburkholderia sp.]|nr:hypothetical protein [Paraburkholderia sp.]
MTTRLLAQTQLFDQRTVTVSI